MISVQISKVKIGEFIHLKNDENSPLWIRSSFERSSRRYSLISYDDSCKELFRKPTCIVFVECSDSIKK